MTEHRVRVVEKNLFLDDQKVFFVNQYSNLVDALWFVIDATTLDGVSVGNSDVYVSWKLGDQAYLFKLTMTQTSTGWESTWPVPDECTQIVGVATVELQLWSKGASTSSGSYLWVSNGLIMSINKANGTPVDLVDPANVLVEQVAEYANQAEQSAQAAQDAADAAQEVVDENLADYLKKTGGTMQGEINMGNYNIGHIARLFGSSSNANYILFAVQGCGGTQITLHGTDYGGNAQTVTVGNGSVTILANGAVNLNSGTGTINANNKRIQNVASPTASGDAANKGYVDDSIAAIFAPRYGVRFSGSNNSGSTVTRLYNAVGLTAAVGTDSAGAENDFDNIAPWSNRRRCCGYWDDSGQFVVNAYEGEPGYATDGSNGEVWVESSLWYYQHTVSEDGVEEIVISTYQYPGFSPAPIFLSRGGQAQPYLKAYTAAYPMATVDGKPTSRSGVFPGIYSLDSAMTAARTAGENYCTTTAGEWYSDWLLMVVEFATRNLQSIMVGATQLPWNSTDFALAAETGTNRIIITASQASEYVVGQTIGIGTSQGGNQVCSNRRITSIETVGDGTALYFDGDPVDIAVGNMVYTLAWITGTCDGVQSSSGSYTSNTSGKYQCIYRGKEKPYGDCYEWCCDVLFQRNGAGTAEDPYTYTAHYLPDPTKYSSGSITKDYVQLGYGVPAVDGNSTELGLDERFPWVRIPSAVGGSATTYYSDYYNYPRSAVTAGRLGGVWYSRGYAGPAFWDCRDAPSYSGVALRARLSFHRP